MPKLSYVPEVDDALPPSRPATLIRIPASAFRTKAELRAALRGADDPSKATLGNTLSAAAVKAAGSDGMALKPFKRSRAEPVLETQVEEANLPQYKPLRPIRTTRAGRPVKTYVKFHHN
jgi:hypothetical protein